MPLGRKNGKPGPSSQQHEQTQLLAELAVVALLGFFEHVTGTASSSSFFGNAVP